MTSYLVTIETDHHLTSLKMRARYQATEKASAARYQATEKASADV